MQEHLTPNDSIISYIKLRKLIKHQITEYRKVQEQIRNNATYYLLQEPEAFGDIQKLEDKIEEWEWLLDILEDDYRINVITV